jgi:preprotein translocase subunit SecY
MSEQNPQEAILNDECGQVSTPLPQKWLGVLLAALFIALFAVFWTEVVIPFVL